MKVWVLFYIVINKVRYQPNQN
ncbi:erythromycin resistance leader peptide [Staphylococcus aureus]